ncbi:MAG: hypothetical protein U0031_18270 [Thermomicrobiales bacterium]
MPDAFGQLLDWIVRNLVIADAEKDVDLNASAETTADAIESNKERAAATAYDRADTLSGPFRSGLILAFEAQQKGVHEIRLDDRNPEENAIADALIAYLVGFDLAESRSVETQPNHYDYFVSVNWDALYRTADSAGIDLPAALARTATLPGD